MKIKLLFATLVAATVAHAQPNISSWQLNTTGAKGKYWTTPGPTIVTMADSSGVTKICHNTTHVYVRTRNLAGNYTMGPKNNPNNPSAQTYLFKFPKSPSQQTGTKTNVPTGGNVGLSVNGVVLFGNRSADSYKSSSNTNTGTGDNLWHCDAWVTEGNTMDTSGIGHSDGQGRYHYHANPRRLYSDPSTAHSPIIAYAPDGYPVYGPFGYSTATLSASSIKRIESSYEMRAITTRTALPNGTVSNPAGPVVSSAFPLGTYVEDYKYQAGSGDLDEYNGRYCVTPEYPLGTYAYFMTTDITSSPAFPYIFAEKYYGVIAGTDGTNVGNSTMPTSGMTCVTSTTGFDKITAETDNVLIYPNPANDKLNISLKNNRFQTASIVDLVGKTMGEYSLKSMEESIDVSNLAQGIYFITLSDDHNNHEVIRFVKD